VGAGHGEDEADVGDEPVADAEHRGTGRAPRDLRGPPGEGGRIGVAVDDGGWSADPRRYRRTALALASHRGAGDVTAVPGRRHVTSRCHARVTPPFGRRVAARAP